MKKILYIILFVPLFWGSCKKEEPSIASPDEISVRSMSGSFIAQPVADNNSIVGVVSNGIDTSLVKFDSNAQMLWQQDLKKYMFTAYNFENVNAIELIKDKNNGYLVVFFALRPNPSINGIRQYFKTIKFSDSGDSIWQLTDSVHQPKTIDVSGNVVNLPNTSNFIAAGFVGLTDGNYIMVSSQISDIEDITYLQMSYYGNDGLPVGDKYYKIPGKRKFINVYSTSKNQLFMPSTVEGPGAFYLMIDLEANIIFDTPAQGILHDTYFFFEESKGNFLVSASYIDNNINIKGAILTLNSTGEYSKPPVVFNMSPTWIMLSAQELNDGYIFSGFNSSTLLAGGIDWRSTFSQEEHHAVILKTDFEGHETWSRLINGQYFSAGAITVGNSPVSFFGGKYERQIHSIFLLKYNEQGEIFY